MTLTVAFVESGKQRQRQSAAVGGVCRNLGRGTPIDRWRIPHAIVAVERGPEVFLAYRNNDRGAGIRGRAVVLGYVVLGRRGRTAAELGQALLQAWRDRGPAFLDELEGSFSIFLFDADRDRCLLATDPMSNRPLWTATGPDGDLVGSDPRHVAELLPNRPAIDRAYLWSFLYHASTVADRSPFEDVRGVEPGVAIEYVEGRPAGTTRYMHPRFRPDRSRRTRQTAAELIDNVRTTLEDICHDRRRPALFLSGGLDSRFVAALCPEGVRAVTFCDCVNREVKIAAAIAGRCGLEHQIIRRDTDWYPSLIDQASVDYRSLWNWNEAHYLPISRPSVDFDHDAATLAFGCDTYFKGLHLKWDRLWRGWKKGAGPEPSESEFLATILDAPTRTSDMAAVLQPDVKQACQEAYRAAAVAEIRRIRQWAKTVPDLWELFWTRSMVRVPEALNLVCLRPATSERNLFSSPRLRKLSLTIPADQRASGQIVREVVRQVGKGLAWLPDAGSWLPIRFPKWTHDAALAARAPVARARGWLLSLRGSRSISGQCAWTRFDRLMAVNHRLRTIIEGVIEDEAALPDEIFDRPAMRQIYRRHVDGVADHSTQLGLLTTFGLFHRSLTEPAATLTPRTQRPSAAA